MYIEDPEIKAMSDLRKSLEANDIRKFERTIRDKKNKISSEPFLMSYIEPLRRRIQEQVLLSITVPYKKITLLNIAIDLNLNVEEVSELLCSLILDGKLPFYVSYTKLACYLVCKAFSVKTQQHTLIIMLRGIHACVFSGKLKGHVDEITGVVTMESDSGMGTADLYCRDRDAAVGELASSLDKAVGKWEIKLETGGTGGGLMVGSGAMGYL